MIAFLTLTYVGLVWLVFIQWKLLPWNRGTQLGAMAGGLAGLTALVIAMNLYQPYSTDVWSYTRVVEIVPRVTGRVIEVPVEGGTQVKRGDVLVRIDPRPFEHRVKQLNGELSVARANRELAQSEYERDLASRREASVSQSDVDSSRARYEATMGSMGSLEAQLEQAKLDLEEATVYAPADGQIGEMNLLPGQIVSERDAQPVMSFLVQENPSLVASYPPNALRHIRMGDRAQIALDRHPGRILDARVVAILPDAGEGPLEAGEDVPQSNETEASSRFAVGFELEEQSSRYEVDGGVGGAAAIYTRKGQSIRIVRMMTIRMYTWLNYFL